MELLVSLLVFFGQPLIGAFVATGFRLRENPRLHRALWLLILTPIYILITSSVPFRSALLEVVPVIAGAAVYVFAMAILTAEQNQARRLAYVVAALAIITVSFSSTTRAAHAMMLAWTCDGTVTAAYHSRNHDAPTLEIRLPDGKSIKLEGVDPQMWGQAKVGTSHLQKKSWDAFGLLDGKPVRIVPQRGRED